VPLLLTATPRLDIDVFDEWKSFSDAPLNGCDCIQYLVSRLFLVKGDI
jgi:hypothetical protein